MLMPCAAVRSRILAFLAVPVLALVALGVPPESAYNVNREPVSNSVRLLLLHNHYQIFDDGTIWPPGGFRPVDKAEMPLLLRHLQSSQRLKALLKLDLIFLGSSGEGFLSDEEQEDVRKILRNNWSYFTLATRKRFRKYFSLRELEVLNQQPPADDEADRADVMTMRDPAFSAPPPANAIPDGGRDARPPASTAPPVAAAPAAPPVSPNPSPVPAVAPAAQPSAPLGVTVVSSVAPAVVVSPVHLAPPVPQAPAVAVKPTGEPSAAPSGTAQPPASTAPLPPLAAEAVRPIASPAPSSVANAEDFNRFLAVAPYPEEVKALLRIIFDRAPDFARPKFLAVATNVMPEIFIDAAKTDRQARSRVFLEGSAASRGYVIALNPQVSLWEHKKMFFDPMRVILPAASSAYAALHMGVPKVEALRSDAAALKVEPGPWGQSYRYADQSLRAAYSPSEMAGELLHAFLWVDAMQNGWDASPYTVELAARSAQMMLYQSVAALSKDDGFLDPELRPLYREWLERPDEFRDFLVHSLSAGRVEALKRRQGDAKAQIEWTHKAYEACPDSVAREDALRAEEAEEALKKDAMVLARSELLDPQGFDRSLQAMDQDLGVARSRRTPLTAEICARRLRQDLDGLQKASAVLAGLDQAEGALRRSLDTP